MPSWPQTSPLTMPSGVRRRMYDSGSTSGWSSVCGGASSAGSMPRGAMRSVPYAASILASLLDAAGR